MGATNDKSSKSPSTNIGEKLTVYDGSNNEFVFIKKSDNTITFEYKPMQAHLSSSGTYSGGTPVLKKLEIGEWTKLMNALENGKANANPGGNRSMGSLLLEYQSGTTTDSFVISMSSKINQELTTFFHGYRK